MLRPLRRRPGASERALHPQPHLAAGGTGSAHAHLRLAARVGHGGSAPGAEHVDRGAARGSHVTGPNVAVVVSTGGKAEAVSVRILLIRTPENTGVVLGRATYANSEWTYTWDTLAVPNGTYDLRSLVTSKSGATAASPATLSPSTIPGRGRNGSRGSIGTRGRRGRWGLGAGWVSEQAEVVHLCYSGLLSDKCLWIVGVQGKLDRCVGRMVDVPEHLDGHHTVGVEHPCPFISVVVAEDNLYDDNNGDDPTGHGDRSVSTHPAPPRRRRAT